MVTACQCYFYSKHEQLAPVLARVLKPSGRFAILYMAWLPEEDPIAGASEELVLKYNPSWTGKGETRHYMLCLKPMENILRWKAMKSTICRYPSQEKAGMDVSGPAGESEHRFLRKR